MPSKRDRTKNANKMRFGTDNDNALPGLEADRALYPPALENDLTRAYYELNESGELRVGGYQLTSIGIIVGEDADQADWERLGWLLFELEGRIQLLIGDWLVYGERIYGQTYDMIGDALGRDKQTLYNYKWVAENVPQTLRRENLYFSHYMLVASLDDEAKRILLEKAAQENWPVARLRREVAAYKQSLLGQPATPDKTATSPLKKYSSMIDEQMRKVQQGFQLQHNTRQRVIDQIAEIRRYLDEVEQKIT